MKNRTYNIIWADDKTSVYNTQGEDNELVDILEKYHIRIVDTAKNAKELRTKLEKRISWVDAVITDANYLRQGDVPESERELSGFFETVNILEIASLAFYTLAVSWNCCRSYAVLVTIWIISLRIICISTR